MTKKMKKIPRSEKKAQSRQEQNEAWISMRTGLIVVTLVSLAMAVLTGWKTIPALGWVEGLLWSIGFGGAVWLVFVGFYFFNRFVRRKRD